MGAATTFDSFEQQFLELIQELQAISISEHHLRESLRSEATKAEAAESARDVAVRAEAEARATAAAAAAGAGQAAVAIAALQDDLAASKMQFELAERHRVLLEEKCSEMSKQLEELQREVQTLRPLQGMLTNLQRQYVELQEMVHSASNKAQREAASLENELRRVEKSASAGAEIRERARLAAAAHVRERRLAANELQHTTHELRSAKAEVIKLASQVAELQCRLSNCNNSGPKITDPNDVALEETRDALEAERAGAARLERALAAALADNAILAAKLHANDNGESLTAPPTSPPPKSDDSNVNNPIDSFLAD